MIIQRIMMTYLDDQKCLFSVFGIFLKETGDEVQVGLGRVETVEFRYRIDQQNSVYDSVFCHDLKRKGLY